MSAIQKLFVYKTNAGPFYIVRIGDRFHPYFKGVSLGSYVNAEQAAEDLAGGHTFSVAGVPDTAALGISDELSEWEKYTEDADDGY